jgi:hypothetical protein
VDLEFIDNYFIVVYLVNARYIDPLYAHAHNLKKNQIENYDHSLINLHDIMFEGEQSYGKLPEVIS